MAHPQPAPIARRSRTNTYWIVGLVLIALASLWSARNVIAHHRGAARGAQLLGILRDQLDSVDSATYNARLYVRTDNPYYKSDLDEDVASVRKNWELARSLALDDGELQAGLRQADEQFQAVGAQLDLAMEARDKNKRDKGLSMLDSEQASQLVQAFNQTVSEMIRKETQDVRHDSGQGRVSESASLVCLGGLVAGLVYRTVRSRSSERNQP